MFEFSLAGVEFSPASAKNGHCVPYFLRKPADVDFLGWHAKKDAQMLRILPRVPSKRKNRIQLYDFGSRLICSGGSIRTRLDHDGKFNFMILFLGRFVGAENQNHKVEVAFQKDS